MTVVDVRQLTEREATRGENREREYTLRYLVQTDDPLDSMNTVLSDSAVPQVGDYYAAAYESDVGAVVTATRVQDVNGDPTLWHLDVTYRSEHAEDPNDQQDQAPEDREGKISYRFEVRERPLLGDYDDNASGKWKTTLGVANSLNKPFDTPPSYEETYPVITVIKDDLTLDMASIMSINDSINLTSFAGAAADTLKLRVVGINERFEDGKRLWQKTYELTYNKRSWLKYVVDMGYKQDDDGNWDLVLLNGAGLETSSTAIHLFTFVPYKRVEFRTVPAIRFLASDKR
jgi:hypothetical protein